MYLHNIKYIRDEKKTDKTKYYNIVFQLVHNLMRHSNLKWSWEYMNENI